MNKDYRDIIKKLELEEHFEGGYYKSVKRSERMIPNEEGEERHLYSVIYYLLTKDRPISKNHRLESDEWWFWHGGGRIEMTTGEDPDLEGASKIILGDDILAGESPQAYVRKENWQESRLISGDYALVSCVVSPGFHIDDFRLREDEDV